MCKHDEWMKICVLCGEVLETTENKSSVIVSAEMNKTVYIAAEQGVHPTVATVAPSEVESITRNSG